MSDCSHPLDEHCQVEWPGSRLDQTVAVGLARSESVYNNCDHEIWKCAVYDRVHQGMEFANISGIRGLDYFASSISTRDAPVLDLGCGSGDACIYLARAYCYRVVGIDINRRQICRARAKRDKLGEALAALIEYRASDLGSCGFYGEFAGAFCLDSLSLMVDTEREIMNVRSALRANAPFLVADVFAGAKFDAAARRFAWYEDGMISLTGQEAFSRILSAAGFCQVTWTDQTDLAVEVFASIVAGVEDYAHASGRQRDPLVNEWLVSSRFYVDAFRERQLQYAWCLARTG